MSKKKKKNLKKQKNNNVNNSDVKKKKLKKNQTKNLNQKELQRKNTEKNKSSSRALVPVEKKNMQVVAVNSDDKAVVQVDVVDETNVSTEKKAKKTFKVPKVLAILLKIAIFLLAFFGVILIVGIIAVAVTFMIWGQDLPDVTKLKETNFAETSTIYDRDGNVLYKIYGEENRQYMPLNQINPYVLEATIAIEDQNFYRHFGFDPIAIIRAQINNMQEDSSTQGASTITQQLAKNLYLSPERTIDRKIKELLLSLQIEWYYSKDEVLELYLNKIPYGSNAFGVEAAANTFFGKSSADLSLLEASILASLPKATTKFSPYGDNRKELTGYCNAEKCQDRFDSKYVWGRKDLVLDRMLKDGKISEKQFTQAWEEGLNIQFQELKHEIKSAHFVFYVRDYLEKKYGKELVESGGLEIITTLDPLLQANAEQLLAERYQTNIKNYGANNASIVAIDPKTGGVLTMVGSVNYWDESIDGQVNVATSLRQPGSTFKPLVYAAAIENAGIGSGTVLGDYKTKFGTDYVPNNSDKGFKGRMTIRQAIAQSRNIPAIKAWYLAGEEAPVLEFLNKVGVRSLQEFKDQYNSNPARKWDFSYGPAMAIGSGETRLLDLVGSFAAFANNGKFNPVNPILEIRDRHGNILEKYEDQGEQVMRPETAYIINSILSDVYARPAGSWRNVLTIPGQNLAAKTGTSNKKIGNANYPNNLLTIGYTPTIAAGTWVGNSDGKHLSLRAWGEFTAAPINKAFLEMALKDKPLVEYEKPEGVIQRGNEYYPPNWDSKHRYDSKFVPLNRKDCSDEERVKEPEICKTKEQQEKDDKAREEAAKAEAERLEAEKNNTAREPERPISSNETSNENAADGTDSTPPVENNTTEPVPVETAPDATDGNNGGWNPQVDNLPPA